MRFRPASYLKFWLSVPIVLSVAQGIDGRSAPYATVKAATQKVESISVPGTKAFPESITSTSILKLSPGATTFEVFARDSAFSPPQGGFGLDGIAFGSDGNLYVTTYTVGDLVRVEVEDGRAGRVTTLSGTQHLEFPDALRALGDNSFLLIEGSGRLDRVVIQGDAFTITPRRSGFANPTSVTRIGTTAWVSEGQLSF